MIIRVKLSICLIFFLAIIASLSADTIPGGDVSGTWYQANSPYYITGNISIPVNDTLTIEPGVFIEFLGGYMFTVQGLLEAIGTESDSITFTASTVWTGLYMTYAPDTCRLEYCIFEKFDYFLLSAVFCSNTNPVISHCRIRNNATNDGGGGITLHDADAQISNCTISGNSGGEGGGILCHNGSAPTIFGCNITDNNLSGGGVYGGGIAIDGGSNPVIDSCVISNNNAFCGGGIAILGGSSCTITDCRISADTVYGTGFGRNGGGIYINSSGGSAVISGTTIDDCFGFDYGGGLYIQNADSVSIMRSIIDGNYGWEGGILYSVDCGLFIDHCDMVNNGGLTTGITLDGTTDMTLSNCIFRSQGWENIHFANYSSASVTYCNFYDWGAPQPFYGNVPAGLGELVQTNYNGDSCDVYYNIFLDPLFEDFPMGDYHLTDSSPCIDAGDPASPLDPDSTVTDMGRYYFIQTGIEEIITPVSIDCRILSCSPNPCTRFSQIQFELGKTTITNLSIYDVSGRLVSTLINGLYKAGIHETTLDVSGLSSGVYFCRLNANGFTAIKKVVVTK